MSTRIRVGQIPYLNSEPFYHGLPLDGLELYPMAPRPMGELAKVGGLDAGPFSLVHCFDLEEKFEPLGGMGISVKGAVRSVVLYSKKPVEALSGALVGVTDETATAVQLMKLLLEQRYQVHPSGYTGPDASAVDALLLIGDKALAPRKDLEQYPYKYDLAWEWLRWQGLPFVFAMWMVRRTLPQELKATLAQKLQKRVAENLEHNLSEIAGNRADLGMPYEDIASYLKNFRYIFNDEDWQAARTFRAAWQSMPVVKEARS